MNPPPSPPRQIEGKYALLVVLFLGVAGAGGGWWYHQRLQSRPLSLWGSEAAHLLLQAPEVELCRLEKIVRDTSAGSVTADGETYQPIDCKDASRLRGFLHLRHSLLNDYSFDWSAPSSGKHDWRILLRFRDGAKTATLLISADFSYVHLAETGATACIQPIAEGVEEVLAATRDEHSGHRSKVDGANG